MSDVVLADTTQVCLTDGTCMLIDIDDLEIVSEYRWHPVRIGNKVYAATKRDGQRVYAHRLVARAYMRYDLQTRKWRATDVVDHINGNGLDNRRANLRIATRSQNQQNTVGRPRHRTSRFKGVSFYASRKDRQWRATIEIDGSQKHLGYFDSEEEASVAYDRAALVLFAEFAYLNTIGRPP